MVDFSMGTMLQSQRALYTTGNKARGILIIRNDTETYAFNSKQILPILQKWLPAALSLC